MREIILIFAGIFGVTGIILGAFGAHLLKKKFTEDQLSSFEVGVRYQIYHALYLLFLGFHFDFSSLLEKWIGILAVSGVLLFSGSIYGLTISSAAGRKWRFLGPITPLGGLCLIVSWGLLILLFVSG